MLVMIEMLSAEGDDPTVQGQWPAGRQRRRLADSSPALQLLLELSLRTAGL